MAYCTLIEYHDHIKVLVVTVDTVQTPVLLVIVKILDLLQVADRAQDIAYIGEFRVFHGGSVVDTTRSFHVQMAIRAIVVRCLGVMERIAHIVHLMAIHAIAVELERYLIGCFEVGVVLLNVTILAELVVPVASFLHLVPRDPRVLRMGPVMAAKAVLSGRNGVTFH